MTGLPPGRAQEDLASRLGERAKSGKLRGLGADPIASGQDKAYDLPTMKPISVARKKTVKVQADMRVAEADLHEANEALANSSVGKVMTRESVQTALEQNVSVEEQLHEAVDELEVVSNLLKIAEARNAGNEDPTVAGRRSGEGADSALAQMLASAHRKEKVDPVAPGAQRPESTG